MLGSQRLEQFADAVTLVFALGKTAMHGVALMLLCCGTQAQNQRGLADASWREHQQVATRQLAPGTRLLLLTVEKVLTFHRITDTDFHRHLTTENLYNNFVLKNFCCKAIHCSNLH
ncbi:hypothetical protein SDC9_133635 [bioreactor metagenome]|uniref:Uncharacterized protein n=1 Tax=bioreactor metagenome TaxID=1076179 RepID=A0A645DAU1_9ZZZZ